MVFRTGILRLAVEHVEEWVAEGLEHQRAHFPLPHPVNQHRRFIRIPIVQVVRRARNDSAVDQMWDYEPAAMSWWRAGHDIEVANSIG